MSGLTWGIRRECQAFRLQGYHLLWQNFPDHSARPAFVTLAPVRKPGCSPRDPVYATLAGLHIHGLGSFPFARRYSGSRISFFSWGYLDVSVLPVVFRTLCIQVRIPGHYPGWVAPFGDLRIDVCSRLPGAFRSLPRPSSTPHAETSTMHP